MSQEMMVTSDSLKKPLAMLPKSPLTQLTAVWEDLTDLSKKKKKKKKLHTIELKHNTCRISFG